jgi:hypothetical protein
MNIPHDNHIDKTDPFFGLLKFIIDNQQAATTFVHNTAKAIGQWIVQAFDKLVT